MSYQSKYTGQEIDNKLDKIGEIGALDSLYCGIALGNYTPVLNEVVPFIKKSGNMNITDGKITINPGKRVQINISLSFYNSKNTFANVVFYLKDLTNDIKIQRIQPSNESPMYEYPDSVSIQYTNETDKDCEIGLVVDTIFQLSSLEAGNTSLTVHEIGRAMVIPNEGLTELPVATTDTLGGIKVGEGLEITEDGILNVIGNGIVGRINYTEVELLNTPIEFAIGKNEVISTNLDIALSDELIKYDRIVIAYDLKASDQYYHANDCEVLTSNIVFNNSDTQLNNGDRRTCGYYDDNHSYIFGYWFKDKAIRIMFTGTNQTIQTYTHFRIYSVKGIKYEDSLGNAGRDSSPIGTIIPYMGTTAPEGFLICDGATLNIADYTKLAEHFETQFGTKNYFGGDGTTTFAVPDLRDEFLRGYHGNKEIQLSGEIGIHQNATAIPFLGYDNANGNFFSSAKTTTNSTAMYGADGRVPTTNTTGNFVKSDGSFSDTSGYSHGYVRPTNVAVLFCIKYTENTNNFNNEPEYAKVTLTNNQELTVVKHGHLVTFNMSSMKDFPNLQTETYIKIGQMPEGFIPSEPAGFSLALYDPKISAFGQINAEGGIYVYIPGSTASLNTQIFGSVVYTI